VKLFHILRGIVRGLNQAKHFNLFFEWFHPNFFSPIMEGTLNAFYQDDEVVHCCLKLLVELVRNSFNRLKYEAWNINGLVGFKESAKYVVKLLQVWGCLEQKTCQ
jgi:hypothetical protein